jgi:hypothetical protein
MLLHCMTQAMKRDGDLKLASLSDQAAVILELTRTDRLFEIYNSAAEAMRSFSHFMPAAMRHPAGPAAAVPPPASAAGEEGAGNGPSQIAA